MRLFSPGNPAARAAHTVRDKDRRAQSGGGIAAIPLDVLCDILLDSLPTPVSLSGDPVDDALHLVHRTTCISRLRGVCKTWRTLLQEPFWRDVAVRGPEKLEALSNCARKRKSEVEGVRRLLYLDTEPTRSETPEKSAMKALLSVCKNLEVLVVVGGSFQVSALSEKNNLACLFLLDCMIFDDISWYKVAFPPTAMSRRPRLSTLRHLTLDGCFFGWAAEKHLLSGLSSTSPSFALSYRHNVQFSLSAYTQKPLAVPSLTSSAPPAALLSHPLSVFLSSPVLLTTLTSISLTLDDHSFPAFDNSSLSQARHSPLQTIYLDLNNPPLGSHTWKQLHPALLVEAEAERYQPSERQVLVLVKNLVDLFRRDEQRGTAEGPIFPRLRKVVLPISWGHDAVFQEYSQPGAGYYLQQLQEMLELRGVQWQVESMEQASLWGKARFTWREGA
ncbi:hypothetical protein JCM11641_000212 [Rhodosporidiobolus odoratus]